MFPLSLPTSIQFKVKLLKVIDILGEVSTPPTSSLSAESYILRNHIVSVLLGTREISTKNQLCEVDEKMISFINFHLCADHIAPTLLCGAKLRQHAYCLKQHGSTSYGYGVIN